MDTPDVLVWRDGHIEALDQTVLPHRVRVLRISTVEALVEAITRLAVRGAPALGTAGALGVALAVRQAGREGWDGPRLDAEIQRIADARPTAVNLRREVSAVAARVPEGQAAVEAAALAVAEFAITASHQISLRGAAYLRDACGPGPLRVHTHCNTGSLACLGWGTALGVIRALHEAGELSRVIVDETRPLLQGARLTCWELGQLGIEHRLVCDGAGPFLISQGLADAVVVGADRVAANGDVANKVGTYGLALAAHRAGIPFLVAAPESTIDEATPDGAAIPIELRADEEVTVPAAPAGTKALNYAFDVTPADLVSAVVTEKDLSRTGSGGAAPSAESLPLASVRRGPLEGELALQVGEAAGAVESDGRLRGVGHDHQRARAEDLAPVAARVPDQRPGQAPAAGGRVGLDVLVAGEAAAGVAHPELGEQPAAREGAEPGAASGLGEPPPGRGPALEVLLGPVVTEAADAQLERLPPVGVGGQRPDLGVAAAMRRRPDGGTGQHGGVLRLQPGGRELAGYHRRLIRGIDGQRDVPGRGELHGERGQPRAGGAGLGHLAEQEEVPPPEARVIQAPDDEVVAAVNDLGAFCHAQRHVRPETERCNPH